MRSVALALVIGASLAGFTAESTSKLGDALLLHASFDNGLNADVAAGDPVLYNSPTGNRKEARPGLPEDNLVTLAKSEGRFGEALRFHKKTRPVFFRGEKNLGYRTNAWSGAVSLWLRLDPDPDLEPGYCDPLQFVGQAWEEGNMFIEFSKDHTPRHFRYAILPVKRFWNPENRGWEDIPEPERPMVAVHKPPFRASLATAVQKLSFDCSTVFQSSHAIPVSDAVSAAWAWRPSNSRCRTVFVPRRGATRYFWK